MAETTTPAHELERRKRLRIRLRPDIQIEPHLYEGRTYYVVKDPISLRYYRLKDNEHFLLQFLDGKHTLEEAQKAYEKRFRPERLKLEDLEHFAQQLLQAGLACNESPRAGKQLFDRRKKRKRTEWMQTLTNILYIKIPVFDPDRLLTKMIRYCWFIFTLWFFALSVAFMLGAVLLVATHFETFRSKLPDYHEFFSFKTVVYLWCALGVVKVIHEFGHGLSCKTFGGEVHEMGALFLCFSPALYCNVSDAWILPNKWHRIIISAAGIYVELIIAAAATFVWWNTPTQPFINNLSLSLMVVCSVSTVVFNANPLMRYDGYYVLADWLEIPNLRERSNRYLSNLFQEHCLGIEVQPEGYMELRRRILFVVYAVVSYVYRWVITFSILYFFYSFLRPYKLEVISNMLVLASIGSMGGWPAYRLGQSIWRRGRLPDMKRWRVMVTASVGVALLAFLLFVPVPISRIRGVGLVQPHADAISTLMLKRPAILKELYVSPGDTVEEDQPLALFLDPELEDQLISAAIDAETTTTQLKRMEADLKEQSGASRDQPKMDAELSKLRAQKIKADAKLKALQQVKEKEMTVRARMKGVVGQGPHKEDVGKLMEVGREQQGQAPPLFTIIEPGRVRMCLPVATPDFNRLREDIEALKREKERTGKDPKPLPVVMRIHGLDSTTWNGKLYRLDESEARTIPIALSSKASGPVPVKGAATKAGTLVPQTQQYLVYVDIENPDLAITPGVLGQVKISCRPESCAKWLWRKVNDVFNLRLM
jgi:putative peptide zinc metalloprotease protein